VSDAPERVATALRLQAGWCRRLGSPLYALLLEHAATDAAARGPVWTVLITWQYLTAAERASARAAVEGAGRAASRDAPVARLSFEPAGREGPYVVRLTSWPGGEDRRLAEAPPHGVPVRWAATA
jgi:hypothetical protein